MIILHLLLALLVAGVLALIFSTGLRRHGPWPGALGFLLLIFLASWAGGIWITPFGPSLWGVFIMPFLIAGIIFALLLAAVSLPGGHNSKVRLETRTERKVRENVPRTTWDIFFWVLLVALVVAIISWYFFSPDPVL